MKVNNGKIKVVASEMNNFLQQHHILGCLAT